MPLLTTGGGSACGSPPVDAEFSQQLGEVIALVGGATSCLVRFRFLDSEAFVEEGRKQPGHSYKDVQVPLDLSFQATYTRQQAEWSVAAQDKFVILPSMQTDRRKKLRAERRTKEKRTTPVSGRTSSR
jgi:hypothetical protein